MNIDITSSSGILNNFTKYVSLNVLSMIGLSCYILADTLFVSNGMGSNGLTALNLVLPVYSFINGIGLMIGIGGATGFSIFHGEKNINSGNKIFTTAIVISAILGILFTILGLFFSKNISVLLGADSAILPLSAEYLKVILIFSPAFMINNVLVCFVRNDGNPKLSMTSMLLASLSNIILDYVFIFPLNMGMFGAALATGLAPIFSMCILSTHFIKHKNNFKLKFLQFKANHTSQILSLGISSFTTEFSSGIVILLFNFTILKLAGNDGVAAYGIIANLALIAVAIFTGIAQGIQPIISQNYGAGKTHNAIKTLIYALTLSEILGIIFYLSAIIFHDPMIAIFNKEQNQILSELASNGITLYFIAFLAMGINIVTSSFFSSIAQPKQSFIIAVTRGLLAVVVLIIVLPQFMGIKGVWITIPCVEFITLFLSVLILKRYFKATT